MHNWALHGPSGIKKLSISSAKSPPKMAENTIPVPDLHCRFLKQRAAPSKPSSELTAILRSQDLQAICIGTGRAPGTGRARLK